MKILGIETSCDETAAAVVEDGRRIITNVSATSLATHAKTGGVIPENAAREQLHYILPVLKESLAGVSVDVVAVTQGPGLIGSLLVGVEAAKALSWATGKRLIAVNHLHGHVYSSWLSDNEPELPAIVLVASGGHTDLVYMEENNYSIPDQVGDDKEEILNQDPGQARMTKRTNVILNPESSSGQDSVKNLKANRDEILPSSLKLRRTGRDAQDDNEETSELSMELANPDSNFFKQAHSLTYLGGTRDDAAGEAFDKTARMLGLSYPGGPKLSELARHGQPGKVKLPRPMIGEGNSEFSFSGLKTAVRTVLSDERLEKADVAWEIEEAITDVLVEKTMRAARRCEVGSIILGGGVVANSKLRKKFEERWEGKLYFPEVKLATDNAAVIAAAAFWQRNFVDPLELQADSSLSLVN